MVLNPEKLEAHELRLFDRIGPEAYLKRYRQAQVRARYKFWRSERERCLTDYRSAIAERVLRERNVDIPSESLVQKTAA
jgi:hypothetical protein